MTVQTPTSTRAEIALRVLGDADHEELERIAAVDSVTPLDGEFVLGAEMEGRLVAAVSIPDGAVVADPFTRTAAAVELLQVRAAQLGATDHAEPSRMRRVLEALGRGHAHAGLAGSPPGAGGKLLEL